jgi:hypothetical protein
MLDDAYKREAFAAIPRGYYRISEGEYLPDDLIWDWCHKEFLRADDARWGPHKVDVADCVCVVRKAKSGLAASVGRSYSVKR